MTGLRISLCHGAPVSRETYTDILGRQRTRDRCDACEKVCTAEVEQDTVLDSEHLTDLQNQRKALDKKGSV